MMSHFGWTSIGMGEGLELIASFVVGVNFLTETQEVESGVRADFIVHS